MKETMLYISITLLGLYIIYLYFHFKILKCYAKAMLKEPNPNDIICLIVKGEKE